MSILQIQQLLQPNSICVVSTSNTNHDPAQFIIKNLLKAGFQGPILPICQTRKSILGIFAYNKISELPSQPDIAIISQITDALPTLIKDLHQKGCHSVILMAKGNINENKYDEINKQTLSYCQANNIRLLGPNSSGIITPKRGLNASYDADSVIDGNLALVSQSSSVCASILDWAKQRKVGFSHVISLGNSEDIQIDECIDYLNKDVNTKAILLYLNNIKQGRRFMSAAREAALKKPLIVLKHKHNETLDDSNDTVYDAAFARAGMLRVNSLQSLYMAIETLSHKIDIDSEELIIVSNGYAPAAMAKGQLYDLDGQLAKLSDEVQAQLNKLNGVENSNNPIILDNHCSPEDYSKVLQALNASKQKQNILFVHAPNILYSACEYAKPLIASLTQGPNKSSCLVSWLGESASLQAKPLFSQAHIPCYRTAENAINGFMQMISYKNNQRLLTETPEHMHLHSESKRLQVEKELKKKLDSKHLNLNTFEATSILSPYSIACLPSALVLDKHEPQAQTIELEQALKSLNFPIALKMLNHSLKYKSDIGAVKLNIYHQQQAQESLIDIKNKAQQLNTLTQLEGYLVQEMASKNNSHELRIIIESDPIFGPIIFIGQGGRHWQKNKDAAAGLLPLNSTLSNYLIKQAFDKEKIKDKHLESTIDRPVLNQLLCHLSQLMIDHIHIKHIDINPVIINKNEFKVIDVTIQLSEPNTRRADFAICPYPAKLEEFVNLNDGSQVCIRPIQAEDEQAHLNFDLALSKEDRYKRYFGEVPQFTHQDLARLTQIDYDREMAFIAVKQNEDEAETIAVIRLQTDPDNTETEFSIIVRSDIKGSGLGKILLNKAITYCHSKKVERLTAITMIDNHPMVKLAKHFGFKTKRDFEEGIVTMSLNIKQ